jgi:hypothetical protein
MPDPPDHFFPNPLIDVSSGMGGYSVNGAGHDWLLRPPTPGQAFGSATASLVATAGVQLAAQTIVKEDDRALIELRSIGWSPG